MSQWPKENNTDKALKIILFLISPFIAFLYSLRTIKTKSSYVVFFLFCVFFGLSFSVSIGKDEENKSDGASYREKFELYKYVSDSEFYNWFNEYFTFELKECKENWLTKTLTVMFRNYLQDIELGKYKYTRDVHLFYHLLKMGKGYYFTTVFGVYNIHSGGIFSLKDQLEKIETAYKIYKELYLHNEDDFTRYMHFTHTLKFFSFLMKKMNM